jgi:hypothetical protein
MGYKDHIRETHSSCLQAEEEAGTGTDDEEEQAQIRQDQLWAVAYEALVRVRDRLEELAVPIGEFLTEETMFDFVAERV